MMRTGIKGQAHPRAMETIRDKVDRVLAVIDSEGPAAAEELFSAAYDELRATAHQLMKGERSEHTLAPTALVHEAYLRLCSTNRLWENRAHFVNAAAMAMRRILVDHARNHGSIKRGRGWKRVKIESIETALVCGNFDWMAIDEALQRFRKVDERACEVVMLRFFAGRTEAEVAELLCMTERQVRRDWKSACLWLRHDMDQEH